jgi:hypothetical protein
MVDTFIHQCRMQVKDKSNISILLDGGWSHPGWWANECCLYALEAETSLPLARYYVIRGKNFQGSSKAMEGFGAEEIAKEMKSLSLNVAHLIHDKDASTLKNFRKFFPKVKEQICSGNIQHNSFLNCQ